MHGQTLANRTKPGPSLHLIHLNIAPLTFKLKQNSPTTHIVDAKTVDKMSVGGMSIDQMAWCNLYRPDVTLSFHSAEIRHFGRLGICPKILVEKLTKLIFVERVGLTLNGNRLAHVRHQCRKTTVLSFHRCLINTGVKNDQHFNID